MRIFLILAALSALPQCQSDETVRAYGAGDSVWRLVELNGAPFEGRATLQFPETGEIVGEAPCNSYSTTMEVPYPWFGTGPLAVTRRACPDLGVEVNFFRALEGATLSEVLGDTMILSDDSGPTLVFKTDD